MSHDLLYYTTRNDRLRALLVDGDPWFMAGDLARALGYGRTPDMLKLVPADERRELVVQTGGGRQPCVFLSEPGLYRVLGSSVKPAAQPFRDWVYKTVLPAIRATGQYGALDRRSLAKMVIEAEDARETAERELLAAQKAASALKPSAGSWDHCAAQKGSWSLSVALRILRRDPALHPSGVLGGRGGMQQLRVAMYQAGFTNHDGTGWVPNPVAVRGERIQVGPKGELRLTPQGLAILHTHLGGSAPLNTEPGRDLEDPRPGELEA